MFLATWLIWKIMAIAERYNLPVIEDAAEALGTYYTEESIKEICRDYWHYWRIFF